MKVLVIDGSRCTRCRTCEYVCSLVKEGRFNPRHARIRVAQRPGATWSLPVTCLQCEEPSCKAVCPAGAILRNAETGAVEVDPERCMGCRMCILACVAGALRPSSDDGKIRKCDLCGGDPKCVLHCPREALQFVELTDAIRQRRDCLTRHLSGLMGRDL